jgi:hypothetical protein
VVCQQAESSPWPWDFGIQTSTVTFDGFALD